MASPNVSRANNENARNTASTPRKANGTRQALGDKSPNVVAKGAIAGSAGKRAMTGSPLKRGFPAAIEDGKGFTFLKRRRISDNQVPSGPYESMERSTTQQGDGNICGFRPLFLTGPTVRNGDLMNESILSPTEPNTPSDSCERPPKSSAERDSFSSLINYDPSSQQHAASSQLPQPHPHPHHDPKTQSQAEVLRLRLRVAMYKVRTDQVDVPFSHLREDTSEGSKESSRAVEDAVAQLRLEAQAAMARSQAPPPKLLPAPVLRPTPYSSRMIYDAQLPSSPPPGLAQHNSREQHNALTPRSGMRAHPHHMSPKSRTDVELTSSAVKGRVAEGLLGLRHAL